MFLSIVDICLTCEDIVRQSFVMVRIWRILCKFLHPVFSVSRVQHISDLHSKFALRHIMSSSSAVWCRVFQFRVFQSHVFIAPNISSTCSHNMLNFSSLTTEIGWQVWAPHQISLLHRCCSREINQTLHDVWPSPGLLPANGISPGAKFTLGLSLAFSYIGHRYCSVLEQCASAKLCGVVQGIELRNFRSSF